MKAVEELIVGNGNWNETHGILKYVKKKANAGTIVYVFLM